MFAIFFLNFLQVNYENKKHAHAYIQIFHPQSEALLIYPKLELWREILFYLFDNPLHSSLAFNSKKDKNYDEDPD